MKSVFVPAILALTLVVGGGSAAVLSAQATVTASDINRLQDRVYDASSELSRLRSRNADLASRMQTELDELREEVIYLKVKLRKEGSVSRTEYGTLRDRIDQLSTRAREESSFGTTSSVASGSGTGTSSGTGSTYGTGSTAPPPSQGAYGTGSTASTPATQSPRRTTSASNAREVPVGAELDIRLQTALSSETAQPEQRFEATTAVDLRGDTNEVLIPAGSVVRGVISDVKKAGRVERKASLTLAFDQITVNGRSYPIRATVAPFEGEGVRGDATKIGTGAGVGAIIGGILGGFKGALAGILIGGGGVVAATEGQDVNLAPGTVLRIRFDSPLTLK
jgi:TolA-binding protein